MSRSTVQQVIGGGSKLLPRRLSVPELRIEHLWVLVPAVVMTWMSLMHPLPKLDFWWHLKVGEVIVTTGEIPRVDLFSFTRAGEPFLHQNWLGEIVYYLVYRIGDLPLLTVFNTVVLLLALIPIYRLCFRANDRLRVAVLCSLLAAYVLGFYSNMRPQSYSFIFFAVYYWILEEYREGRRDRLWLLPVLMVLWVNLHGAFVLGIGVVGLVLVSETIRRAVRGQRAGTLEPAALRKLALVLGLTLLAALLNPETYRVFAYVRQLQVDPASQTFVTEWQVPDVKQLSDILIFFAPFSLVVLVFFYARRRPDLTELALFLAFAVLGLAAIRSGIWFALIAAPILARHVSELEVPNLLSEVREWPYVGRLVRRVESRRQTEYPVRYRLNWAILALLLLFTVVLSPWVRPHLEAERLRPWLVEREIPVDAMDYIAEHELSGNIFHPQVYGDYLIWRLWPQQRSFFDGRVHLYDEDFARDYILTFHDDNWESRIAKYDIQYLLLPKDDEGAASIVADARSAEAWTLLYEDEVAVLFERRTG
ncbi:MAG: hypothetical protein MAG451_02271 [Anaerolineales bacterium]|nr:hypothetical protein [Anaerolineales bacterium]